jgi:ParB-like chromosome segregation protein Spo0J
MTKLDIANVRIDGGTQSRKQVYEDTVIGYTEHLLEGGTMPAVDVFYDGKFYWLADGFHRYHAHKRAGHKTIECNVHNGIKRDAFIFSRGANADHGLPRTNEEKRMVVVSLLEDIEYADASDRDIAKICRVSHMTVGRIKKARELNKKQKLPAPPPAKPSTKAAPSEAPEDHTADDKAAEMASEMQFIAEENAKLRDQLAIMNMDGDDEAKAEAANIIRELREQVKDLEMQLKAVTISRNDFQNKCGEAIKQVSYWKKRADKADQK